MRDQRPHLSIKKPSGEIKAVVLVLHGGSELNHRLVRPWRLAYLRMVPIARAVLHAGAEHGIAVALLRNRLRGWNAPDLDPVVDARWALEKIHAEYPDRPVVLVGHSMGGRVALRIADDPAVVGVCALAPWTPGAESTEAVKGKAVLIAHGVRDRMTDPAASYSYARRAQAEASRLARFEVSDEGHAMLRRAAVWSRLVCAFTLEVLGMQKTDRFNPSRVKTETATADALNTGAVKADGIETDAAKANEAFIAAWRKPSEHQLRIPL